MMRDTCYMKMGFSTIELIITIGIAAALFGLSMPLAVSQYRSREFASERDTAIALFRKARSMSMANRDGKDHGVYTASASYVVFTGDSYAARDTAKDEDFPRNGAISIRGGPEIVFDALSGATGSLSFVLFDDARTATISINAEGTINYK